MKIEIAEAQWLDQYGEVSLEELAELSGLSSELLMQLVDYGALAPVESGIESPSPARTQSATQAQPLQWRFSGECVAAVRTVSRLREDFDLDANALSVTLMLIERVQALETQLQALQCQLPQHKQRTRD